MADQDQRHAELGLQLYKITGNVGYLRFAEMAYQWVRSCLLQPSGLYADHVNRKGVVEPTLWSYNQGTMIGAGTLLYQITGDSSYLQQAEQIRTFREAWKAAGHAREPRVSVSRSIFALVDDRDRAYFGGGSEDDDTIGFLGDNTRAIFGRSYAAEPDILVEQLAKDEAIAQADTLLLTVPNQLGVKYNAHVIESVLTHVAPALGWR